MMIVRRLIFALAIVSLLLATRGAISAESSFISISSIQFTTDPSGDSPLVGQVASIQGVVYGVYGQGFAVADAAGAWNGIYVYNPSGTQPAVGDEVQVTGTVAEFFNKTELSSVTTLNIVSSGNTPFAAEPVETGSFAPSVPTAESYEGVLVQVDNVTVTNENPDAPSDFGEWEVDDGSGGLRVDDLGDYTYAPTLTDELTFVRGMLDYSFSNFKLQPRDNDDIDGGSPPSAIPISDIQFTTDPAGDSPLDGQSVIVEGIVYAVYPQGFGIADDAGPWNGVYVYAPGAALPAIGDEVEVQAQVNEFFGMTELSNVTSITTLSSGNTPYAASDVEPADINTGSATAESYEGTFVSMENVVVSNENADAPDDFGEFEVSQNGAAVRVDDLGAATYEPLLGDNLSLVRGMLLYSFSNFKVEPRDDGDIVSGGVGDRVFITLDTPGIAGGVSYDESDILLYNGAWSKVLDGTDLGLIAADIDAFEFVSTPLFQDAVLISFSAATSVPGMGVVPPQDVVLYNRITEIWLPAIDGSDVGLTTADENIDGVTVIEGKLAISTSGPYDVANAVGDDEDIIVLTDAVFGSNTSGTWELYFDGSDVVFGNDASRDLNALAFLGSDLYFSTLGDFTIAQEMTINIDAIDVHRCNVAMSGEMTSCSMPGPGADNSAFFFQGDLSGLTDGSVNGTAVELASSLEGLDALAKFSKAK